MPTYACVSIDVYIIDVHIYNLPNAHTQIPPTSESGVLMKARVTPLCFYGKPAQYGHVKGKICFRFLSVSKHRQQCRSFINNYLSISICLYIYPHLYLNIEGDRNIHAKVVIRLDVFRVRVQSVSIYFTVFYNKLILIQSEKDF